MAFGQKSTAERKPTLACVGYVKSFGDLKKGANGSLYWNIPVEIESQGAYRGRSGMSVKVNLSFLPEFFSGAFDPRKVGPDTHGEKHRGVKFSYDRNIASPEGQCGALLECIVGDEDNWLALVERINATDGATAEDIYETLTTFFSELGPVGFGYILRQPNKKTDQVDPETGKPKYEMSAFYEVDTYFRINEKTVKALVTRATKNKAARQDDPSKEKFELRFTPSELGFDIEAD